MQQHAPEVGLAVAKAAPPTFVTAATILGYPVENIIVWLTLIWWVWILGERLSNKAKALLRARRIARERCESKEYGDGGP
jgi:hypothetical protein